MSVFFRAAALARVLYDSTIIHDAKFFSPLVIAPDVCLFARRLRSSQLDGVSNGEKKKNDAVAESRDIGKSRAAEGW
jgi:hypothetical protein